MSDSGADSSASPLSPLRESLAKLYDVRDKFFTHNPVEKAGEKKQAIADALAESVKIVSQVAVDGSQSTSAELAFLEGKALNVTEEFDPNAETALSKAVKLDPKQIEGWNQLGECFWKKRDHSQAKSCFESGLKVAENKVGLRSLSMLLRQIGTTDLEKKANVVESLDLAKRAIKVDITDGHSWFVMGNAYLALFFASMDTVEHVRQALKAYKRAETDKVEATNNPDLHQNRATIHKYQEDYGLAIEGFQLASWLDPSWPEPKQSLQDLQDKLERICNLIEKKGGIKPKKISGAQALLAALDDPSQYTPIAELKEGINDQKNIRVTVMSIFTEEQLPQTLLAIDEAGTWVCVTIYNMVQGVLSVDDTIEIPEPYLRNVKVVTVPVGANAQSKSLSYLSIRVDNPVTIKKGGIPLGETNLVKAQITIKTMGQ